MNIWEELTISVPKPQFYRSWLFIDTIVCLWCIQRVAHWDKCMRAWCSGGDGTGTVGKAWKMTLTCGRAALPVCRSTDWTVQHVVDAWTLPQPLQGHHHHHFASWQELSSKDSYVVANIISLLLFAWELYSTLPSLYSTLPSQYAPGTFCIFSLSFFYDLFW